MKQLHKHEGVRGRVGGGGVNGQWEEASTLSVGGSRSLARLIPLGDVKDPWEETLPEGIEAQGGSGFFL
ncbi:hypothetical protein KSC_044230 [Ktedonobacter sp. SOSP1-52]|nr:hypothetical protein KSC_044230 [Ktedonobacter sp. SOSP1-52]